LKVQKISNKVDFYDYFMKIRYKNKHNLQYLNLKHLSLYKEIQKIFLETRQRIFCENIIFKNKIFLLNIAKVVDEKINSISTKFRAINDMIYIDVVAETATFYLYKNSNFKVIKFLKFCDTKFQYQKKEMNVLKFILAAKFLKLIFSIKENLSEIDEVIQKTKSAKKVKIYKNNVLCLAEYYAICKFNSKLSQKIQNRNLYHYAEYYANLFIKYIFYLEKLFKKIISYLHFLFD